MLCRLIVIEHHGLSYRSVGLVAMEISFLNYKQGEQNNNLI
jgi:hypothetical protein